MPAYVQIAWMRAKIDKEGAVVVNTCSNSDTAWQRDLSPFILGPCDLYDGRAALTMENAWQYAKVYPKFLDENGDPTEEYWEWAEKGWKNPKAVRFPMGKGKIPSYSLWEGQKLAYIDARKLIYAPVYAEAVQKTAGFKKLVELYETEDRLILRDWDGHDHNKLGLSLTEVLNNPKRIMGHAFVLKMLLTKDPALKQLKLR